MKDKNGIILHVGDIVRHDDGYDLIVSIDSYGSYFGKLMCDENHSCKDMQYCLTSSEIVKINMEQFETYCTEEQTKKAFELGAPLKQVFYNVVTKDALERYNLVLIDGKEYKIPTAGQMIEWLEKRGISEILVIKSSFVGKIWGFGISDQNGFITGNTKDLNSRKEATLAAIDASLEYLTNNI